MPSEFQDQWKGWFAPRKPPKRGYLTAEDPPRWTIQRRTMPEAPRVAHVVLSLDVGGLERLVVDLVREGLRLGQRPMVVCLEWPGELAPQVEALGVEVDCVYKQPGVRPATVKPIARVLKKFAPHVVHTHQIGALAYAGPAARRLGKKGGRYEIASGAPVVIHTEHGKHYSRRRTRWLGRIAGRYAERFCCVSQDIAEDVRAAGIVPGNKIVVVPNGIDVARFASGQFADSPWSVVSSQLPTDSPKSKVQSLKSEIGIPAGAAVVGTVGRLNEVKRQEVLIRAFARMGELKIVNCKLKIENSTNEADGTAADGTAERGCYDTEADGTTERGSGETEADGTAEGGGDDAHLLIVGEGPLRGELQRLAGELGVGERVHFVGYQAAPERYLAMMDVFALTSRSEGMPLSILEAWAAGLPVVASAVGGVPELVVEGETGLLFASEDIAAAVQALEKLLSDRELAQRLATASRERVKREYSLARTAETYQQLYRELYTRQCAIEELP